MEVKPLRQRLFILFSIVFVIGLIILQGIGLYWLGWMLTIQDNKEAGKVLEDPESIGALFSVFAHVLIIFLEYGLYIGIRHLLSWLITGDKDNFDGLYERLYSKNWKIKIKENKTSNEDELWQRDYENAFRELGE